MARALKITPPRIMLGVAVLAWIVVAVAAPWQTLADDSSTATSIAYLSWGWALWLVTAVALLVPSPLSLTAMRCISPVAVIASFGAVSPLSIFASLVALIIGFSPLFADVMVQGGAYGEERRFALKTPVPQMLPTVIAWSVLSFSLIGGTLLTTDEQFAVGIPLLVIGVILATRVPKLLHRHSRRWLVIVPAGIVVHDHLVLAETVMSPRSKIASLTTVAEAGESADFTGGVAGQRLAVQLREADKIVLSRITAKILGTTEALHVTTFSVAPRRLQAARDAITL
ncbi:MAG: hypothetical protein ACO3JF_06215 [Ilumatobacteraceae bacterium]